LKVPAALSTKQIRSLDRLEQILRSRAVDLGMIAGSDRDRIRVRHLADSLRALGCVGPGDRHLVDLGSGAGLPGVPLAIALPDRSFTLVESRRKRGAFLEFVIQELGLTNVRVVIGRVEDIMPGRGWPAQVDVCLARAFAPPLASWRAAERLLQPSGRLVYFAGVGWDLQRAVGQLGAAGVAVRICSPKAFTWQGPLVMMDRFSASDGSQDHGQEHAKHARHP
jgi:16S rRNA (guanine527-N7)-methyltransferase